MFFGFTALSAQTQSGKATFYAKGATGARTANGERLHHDSMTCAHRTYPFGTLLQVINPKNGKQVVVRVNDRGPFIKGRIIDLSWGAAKKLGIIAQGVAMVEVKKVGKNRIPFKDEEESDIPDLEIAVTSPPLFDEWKNELEENQIEPSKALIPEKSHKQIVKKKTDSKFKEALEKIKNLDFHLF
jgi:rare lipoprotein A